MKIAMLFCCLATAIVGAQAPARDTSATAAGTAIVRGRVTLAGTDQPLGRVDVRASSPALKVPRAVKSGSDGRYEIADLPPGRYVVSAVKANFVTAAFGQRRPLGPGVPFELAARQIADKVDFAMARAGVITGRVVDEFGDPVSDVQVGTLRYQYVNGERRLSPGQGRGTTNDIGEFRIFGLPPGDYFLSATLRSFGSPDGSDDRSGYAPTYYPGTGNVQQAQRIAIVPGQTVGSLSMALLPVRTSRISGVALDADGRPLSSGMVMAMARVGMMNMSAQPGQIMKDGRFTIGGLTPGDYILRANGGSAGRMAVLPITVNDADISDVQVVVQPLGSISGRVVFDTDANLPKPSVVRITAQRPDPMLGVGGPLAGTAKEDYTFDIKVLPGHAIIRGSQPSNDLRFKRATLNGDDISDTGVDIPPNGAVSNLVIEFTSKLNELSGTVVDAPEPAVDAWAVIFSQDARKWTPPSRFVVTARPDKDNHFRVRLMAGDYYAILLDDVEQGEWTDPEYLARVRERATPFSIADGEKKSIELKMSSSR